MKKKSIFLVAAISACALFAFAACDLLSIGEPKNPYEVATELGYEGGEAEWLSSEQGGSSEIRRVFLEAVEDGYEGSYLEFLKEIGYGEDDSAAVNAALTSTVDIVSAYARTRAGQTEEYASSGAGVFYKLDRENGEAYVVTNFHVVYSANSTGKETVAHVSDKINLYLYGDVMHASPIAATYVGGCMHEDVAVLRIRNSETLKKSSARKIEAADSDALTVGERVYAVGNPNGGTMSAVSGIVSVEAEYISVLAADDKTSVSMLEIRTDAPINHGNSGGGLYNADGKLVGIVNARLETSGVDHFGYAIPVNTALAVAQNIIDNASANNSRGVLRAMLGVTVSRSNSHGVFDEKTGKTYVSETVTVTEVTLGGAASGKLKIGDVLYSVRRNDGEERIVTRRHVLTNALYDVRRGDTFTIVVARGDKTEEVTISFDQNTDFSYYS